MPDERDPYADVPPPSEADGPHESDDTDLEEESHPSVPEDSHSVYRFEWNAWPSSPVDQITYPEGVDPKEVLDDLLRIN